MTLSEQRCLFTSMLPRLIDRARELGFDCAGDQLKRTQAEADANAASGAGISNSLHLLGLALDLLLYRDGIYIKDSEQYRPLGEYWKSLHALNCWGGDFLAKPDGNHFSSQRGGVK
jgi:hypothetical protein